MRVLFLLLCAALVAQPALAQTKPGTTLKKCQDAKGTTHYYDRNPPRECSEAEITEMSKRGVVKRTIAAPPTEDEVKARADEAARMEEEAKRAEQQARRDKALLDTYTDESEIDLARNRNLQANEASLKNAELRLKSVRGKLDQSRKQAESFAKQGKPVPDWLNEELATHQKEAKRAEEEFAARQKEQDAIRARFEADKQRFRVLKSQQPMAAPRQQ